MRFLCVSDIYGHANKLKQVLEEGRVLGFDQLIVCGDLLFPGPEPLETWKLLVENHALCIQGLTDRAVATLEPESLSAETDKERARVEQLMQLHDSLGELIVARLARLKDIARLPLESGHELVVVHGSPSDPSEPMTVDMDDDELNALLADDPADIVVCGASHVPFVRQLDEIRIVNVGSVGESPTPGIANAVLIESTPLGVEITPFDVDLTPD
jgi:predicted phosphodiesterase